MKIIKFLLINFAIFVLICTYIQAEDNGFEISYNSSGLTIINIYNNKLEYTYHTFRKDMMAMRASMESYDKHKSEIKIMHSPLLSSWSLFLL